MAAIAGDTVFALGTLALGWFVLGLKTGWSIAGEQDIVMRPYLTTTAAERSELAR